MGIGYILTETKQKERKNPNMTSSPVNAPFPDPKITSRFRVQSQSSSSERLSSSPCVSLLSAYIHSSSVSKCRLSISPSVCAFPSSAPSAVQVCEPRVPGHQLAHRPPFFFPVFTLPYSVKERRKRCGPGARACHEGGLLNSSKRGGDVAVPLLTVVLFFQ